MKPSMSTSPLAASWRMAGTRPSSLAKSSCIKPPENKKPAGRRCASGWMSAWCCRLLRPPRARYGTVVMMAVMVCAERHNKKQSSGIVVERQELRRENRQGNLVACRLWGSFRAVLFTAYGCGLYLQPALKNGVALLRKRQSLRSARCVIIADEHIEIAVARVLDRIGRETL